jgi:hypothetical protein
MTFLGGGNILQGAGTWIAPAQAQEDQKDDDDKDKNKFDHFACYNIVSKHSPKVLVELHNQFTDKKGVKVFVKDLKLLCVPTKKKVIKWGGEESAAD